MRKTKTLTFPNEIVRALEVQKSITLTQFDNKNDILSDHEILNEIGYGKFDDGSYLVSVATPMPGVTADMINWWFWWHPQAKERYRMWFPGAHISVSYARKDKEYFSSQTRPDFKPNTQFPVEKIAGIPLFLAINFVTPEEFGFASDDIEQNTSLACIVAGHVSAFRGLIPHTDMAHVFFKADDGLLLVSRFWLGRRLENKFVRKIILNDRTARGMAEHCYAEYSNLAAILPDLYDKYGS